MSEATQTQILRWENEQFTKAKRIITSDHSYIHEGIFYETFLFGTIPTMTSRILAITTPPDKFIHYRTEKVSTSADKIEITLSEDAVISGGVTLTAFNHNRNVQIPTTAIVKANVTVVTPGIDIAKNFIGGGTNVGGRTIGADISEQNEWILKQDTTYTITVYNGSAANNVVCINTIFYEEQNGI